MWPRILDQFYEEEEKSIIDQYQLDFYVPALIIVLMCAFYEYILWRRNKREENERMMLEALEDEEETEKSVSSQFETVDPHDPTVEEIFRNKNLDSSTTVGSTADH